MQEHGKSLCHWLHLNSDRLSYEDQVGPVPFSNCSSSFGSFFIVFSVLVTPSRYHLQMFAVAANFFQMFVHGQTSKTIRMLDQLLDGHQDCCMWPSHSGCDHAYRNESARQVRAGKKGHVTWAAHMSLKVSKDRQHIGSVASTAVILWHWLLDLQLWVSSIREISIEAEAFKGLFQLSILKLHRHDTLCLWADWWPYQAAWKARDVQLFNGFLPCPRCSHDFDVPEHL